MTRIGMSLPLDYLTSQKEHAFDRLFGPVDAMLKALRKQGVGSIEIRAVYPHTQPAACAKAVGRVWDAGLDLTIHGWLPAYPIHGSLEQLYPALHEIISPLRRRNQSIVIPLHAYQQTVGHMPTLVQQTVESLASLARMGEKEDWPFVFALELNRDKKTADPSVTYECVLAMHQQVGHRRVGICWDWGHGYANCLNGLLPCDPPQAFLEHTIHTHIHDLNITGTTHWPLTEGRLPYQHYMAMLHASGYQGIYNLELSPQRYEHEPHVSERVMESIHLLAQAMEFSQSRE